MTRQCDLFGTYSPSYDKQQQERSDPSSQFRHCVVLPFLRKKANENLLNNIKIEIGILFGFYCTVKDNLAQHPGNFITFCKIL